jgi:hypothetical protein
MSRNPEEGFSAAGVGLSDGSPERHLGEHRRIGNQERSSRLEWLGIWHAE